MRSKKELLQEAVGRMPPFKPELRWKVRGHKKTQTRRIVIPQPPADFFEKVTMRAWECHKNWLKAPYSAGVRFLIEPLKKGTADGVDHPVALYQDDDAVVYDSSGEPLQWRWNADHLSSIHMPNEAARFFVYWSPRRIERVKMISAEDARSEGVEVLTVNVAHPELGFNMGDELQNPIHVFSWLWDKINADRGYPFEDNPSVWVYDWKPISEPVEFILGYPVVQKELHGN